MNLIQKLKRTPYVNNAFIIIMVIVYLLMNLKGNPANPYTVIEFGGKYDPLVLNGQWWRLLTAAFVHLSFTHILFNGIVLYFIGNQIEMIFGHWRYACLFILASIGGNLASLAFSNSTLSAGSSTAVFGLFGASLMIGEQYWENPQIKQMTKTFGLFIILNLATDLITVGIDIQGHLGGLVTGFLVAYVLGTPQSPKNIDKRVLALITLIVLLLVTVHISFN